MALDNVPKTNYTTDDGITTDDINNINLNILDLEDDKIESGDTVSSLTITTATIPTGDITTGNVTTGNITTGNITTLNMAGAINPTTSPTASSQAISAGGAWVPARGDYTVSIGGTLQILVSASWRTVNVGGGSFHTDGITTRIFDNIGSGVTVYYLKF